MSYKKQRVKTHDFQLSYIKKENYEHENFIRMYRSIFYSERFIKLSPTTKNIYIALLLEMKNDKRISCIFPKSAYNKITTKETFKKAIKELEENGFIRVHRFKTKAHIYYLSDNWKKDIIPKEEYICKDISEYNKLLKG